MYRMPNHRHHFLHLDFETYSELDLRVVGAYRYAEHESTEVLMAAYSLDDGPVRQWQPHLARNMPRDLVSALSNDDVFIVAHNAEFERRILIECLAVNVQRARYRCTAARAAAAGLPRGLDGALAALGHPIRKDPRGALALRKFSRPRKPTKKNAATRLRPQDDPETWQVLLEYNAQDIVAEKALDQAIPDLTTREWRYFQYTAKVNDRGLPLDLKTLEGAAKVSAKLEQIAKEETVKITGCNPTQVAKIREWLEKNKCPLPNLQLKTIETALREGGLPSKVATVLALRLEASRASTKKIKAMREVACESGRAHGTILYYGAHCVPGDVEALTLEGWVRLDQFTGGLIAQVDEDQNISFLHAEPFKGPIVQDWVHVRAPYLNCMFTRGHAVPYLAHGSHRWKTMPADGLLMRTNTDVPIGGALKHHGRITAEQMRVLVMVQADGSYETKICNGRGLTIFVKKPRKIERARQLLNAANVVFRENTFASHPGFVRFSVRWADLPDWLTVERKIFGPWLLDSTNKAREAFINELTHWDGHLHVGRGNHLPQKTYYSSVRQNAEWVTTLAHTTGRAATLGVKPDKRGDHKRQLGYRVTIREHCFTEVNTKRGHVELVVDKQRAYCVKSQTGYWLARQGTRIFVTGNTGRFSGKLIQPHNFPRGLLSTDKKEQAAIAGRVLDIFGTGDAELAYSLLWHNPPPKISGPQPMQGPMSMLAQSMRGFIRAPNGMWFVVADYAAIEARILAWLANETKLIIAFRNKVDTYKMMASVLYDIPVDQVNSEQRRIGKNLRLGAGYQLGPPRLIEHCEKEEIFIDLEFAKKAIKAFRDDNRNTVKLWYDSEDAAIRAMQTGKQVQVTKGKDYFFEPWRDWLLMVLPSGRRLHYYAPRVDTVVKFGKPKLQLSYSGYDKGRIVRTSTYGGKLIENAVQSIARDVLMEGMLAAEDAGYPVLASIHDEIVTLRKEGEGSAKELEQVICRMPRWAQEIPLGAEGFTCQRYTKG